MIALQPGIQHAFILLLPLPILGYQVHHQLLRAQSIHRFIGIDQFIKLCHCALDGHYVGGGSEGYAIGALAKVHTRFINAEAVSREKLVTAPVIVECLLHMLGLSGVCAFTVVQIRCGVEI